MATPALYYPPDDSVSTNSDFVNTTGAAGLVTHVQSSLYCNDQDCYNVAHINQLLERDIENRAAEVGENIAEFLFPDSAFGFAINSQFIRIFRGMFVNDAGLFDTANFENEARMSVFLNRVISTIVAFFDTTNIHFLKNFQPLRYFTALHSEKPIDNDIMSRKPDLTLVRLIDGSLRNGEICWSEVQGLIETTCAKAPRMAMKDMIVAKSYLTFCNQAERDSLITLSITGNGFHIVVADHAGMVDTDVLPFNRTTNSLIFLRMVMGMAFLPDNYLGVDSTIICRELGVTSGVKFTEEYTPFSKKFPTPSTLFLHSKSPSWFPLKCPTIEEGDRIAAISVNGDVYPVVRVVYEAKSMIGRATKVFLVILPNGELGVVKDSFILPEMQQEVDFLRGLSLPFVPELIDGCVLGNTDYIRSVLIRKPMMLEGREKRRVVTRPAGVPISNFSNLWELINAFLDVVIAIMCLESENKLHRDISYTNILLRDGLDSNKKLENRNKVMQQLGLTQIETQRVSLKCREGLLIDFDYGAKVTQSGQESQTIPGEVNPANEEGFDNDEEEEDQGGGASQFGQHTCVRTGTPPFIAMEILMYGVPHRVAHDLESVFYVLLFICTHLKGPQNDISDPPLFMQNDNDPQHPSAMKVWLRPTSLSTLGHLKYSHMAHHFELMILPHISSYFDPLKPHLRKLWRTLHPQITDKVPLGMEGSHSTATPIDVINVFKEALQDPVLINAARFTKTTIDKRAKAGDQTFRYRAGTDNHHLTGNPLRYSTILGFV